MPLSKPLIGPKNSRSASLPVTRAERVPLMRKLKNALNCARNQAYKIINNRILQLNYSRTDAWKRSPWKLQILVKSFARLQQWSASSKEGGGNFFFVLMVCASSTPCLTDGLRRPSVKNPLCWPSWLLATRTSRTAKCVSLNTLHGILRVLPVPKILRRNFPFCRRPFRLRSPEIGGSGSEFRRPIFNFLVNFPN